MPGGQMGLEEVHVHPGWSLDQPEVFQPAPRVSSLKGTQ